MKITAKQYAQALLEATEGKTEAQVKAVLKKLAAAIIKNNDESKLNDMVVYYAKKKDELDGLVEAEIISAREMAKETIASLKEYIRTQAQAQKLTVRSGIDKNLLGGVVLKFGDKIIDLSIKNKLEQLKSNLNK